MRRSLIARAFLVACLVGTVGCGSDGKGGKDSNKQGFEAAPLAPPPLPGGTGEKGDAPVTDKSGKPKGTTPGGKAGVD